MNKKIIFSTGGTGGHIFPAINLMNHFSGRGYDVLLVTDDNLVIHQNGSYIQNNIKKNALDVATSFEAKRNCDWDANDGRNVTDAKYKLQNKEII